MIKFCTPYGIRTRVTRLRTWRPRPLDERGQTLRFTKTIILKYAVLGGEDLNPQRLDQNQLCCQLHHPRKWPIRQFKRNALLFMRVLYQQKVKGFS